jgi:hypothetical protein
MANKCIICGTDFDSNGLCANLHTRVASKQFGPEYQVEWDDDNDVAYGFVFENTINKYTYTCCELTNSLASIYDVRVIEGSKLRPVVFQKLEVIYRLWRQHDLVERAKKQVGRMVDLMFTEVALEPTPSLLQALARCTDWSNSKPLFPSIPTTDDRAEILVAEDLKMLKANPPTTESLATRVSNLESRLIVMERKQSAQTSAIRLVIDRVNNMPSRGAIINVKL